LLNGADEIGSGTDSDTEEQADNRKGGLDLFSERKNLGKCACKPLN